MIMKPAIRLLSFLVLCQFIALSGRCTTWQKAMQFPGTVSIVKFFPNNLGLAGLGKSPGSGAVSTEIWRSLDGGVTWTKCATPNPIDGELTDFFMVDANHGYATIATSSFGALWETQDGGATWTEGQTSGDFSAVYVTHEAVILADLVGVAQNSLDGGSTYNNIDPNSMTGIDFVDDLHGVMTTFRGPGWYYTSDGGVTWQLSHNTIESWSVYGVKGTSNFYASPEIPAHGSTLNITTILRSTDFGATWNPRGTLTFHSTGTITGIGDAILFTQYCCNNCAPVPNGVYQSTDQGMTWQPIGGPTGWNDSRMSILGGVCGSGQALFAPDQTGGLWKYDLGQGTGTGTNAGIFTSNSVGTLYTTTLQSMSITAGVQISNTHKLDTMHVASVSFSIVYDPNVIDIDQQHLLSLIQPPAGWMVSRATVSNGVLSVTLTDTSSQTVTNAIQLGKYTFQVYGASGAKTLVTIGNFSVMTTDGEFIYCGGLEGDFLANVVVQSESVQSSKLADAITLSPNPLRGSTMNVNIQMNQPNDVAVTLYDILGREIKMNENTVLRFEAGQHTLPLDLSGVPNGTYYVRIAVGGVPSTLKCVVSR
jgi:hypothetical protein